MASLKPRKLLTLSALLGIAAFGCDSASRPDDTGGTSDVPDLSLNGHTTFGSDCSDAQIAVIKESLHWARVAANSSAFTQCVDANFRRLGNPTTFCAGDSTAGLSSTEQFDKLISSVRSFNDIDTFCTGGNPQGNASAGIGTYDHLTPDTFHWNGQWFSDLTSSLVNPVCPATGPQPALCRGAPEPWPYNQLAGIIVHEASHAHGYVHGDNVDNALAQPACGKAGVSGWDFQRDTLPYIVGECISSVLTQSWQQCGDIRAGCGASELKLLTQNGGNSCTCTADTGWRVIGGAAKSVAVGGAGIYATYPGNGNLLQYDQGSDSWNVIGGPGRQFVVNDQSLYAITGDGSQVVQFSGGSWGAIGGPSKQLIAGGSQLYSIWPDTGDIYRYDGIPLQWTLIGGPGAQFVANDVDLYARSLDNKQVLKFQGTPGNWDQIGGDSKLLVAGGNQIFSVYPGDDAIYRFDASSRAWSVVGGPASGFAANRSGLYGRSSDGLAVYKLPTGQNDWETVGGAYITDLFAAANVLVARHRSGDLMVLQGQ